MKVNNINNVTFGTGSHINYVTAINELPKYDISLTNGLFNALDNLYCNGVEDKIVIQMGKNKTISDSDILKIDYYPVRHGIKSYNIKNSIFINLKELTQKTTDEISKSIISLYEKVKKSPYQDYTYEKLQIKNSIMPTITEEHKTKIQELIDCFGSSD